MAAEVEIAPAPQWSKQVSECAAKHGAGEYLLPIWEMTRRLFPAPLQINVFVEDDPEIADLQFIVFEVKVPGWHAQQMYEAERRWIAGLLECYPSPRLASFVLGFEPSGPCEPKTSCT